MPAQVPKEMIPEPDDEVVETVPGRNSAATWRAWLVEHRSDYHESRHEDLDFLIQDNFLEALFAFERHHAQAVMEATVAFEDMLEWHRGLVLGTADPRQQQRHAAAHAEMETGHPAAHVVLTFHETGKMLPIERARALEKAFHEILERAIFIEQHVDALIPDYSVALTLRLGERF